MTQKMRIPASRLLHHLLPMAVIAVVAVIINAKHLNEPPAYIHAWAQADNYSLALGFLHNGGDLLHPQTMIYNKQQYHPDIPESTVTACDLPLHHWIAAGLMAVSGSREPWVFRGLTLVVAILGLWALYLLAYVLTRSRAKGLLVGVVAATSPVFAYYSGGFIPTVPSLSLAIGGLLLYVLHLRDGRRWMLYASLGLFTLAMMQRTSAAVLWVAVACFEVLRIMRREASLHNSWPPFAIGAVLFAAWQLWSIHLRHEYGSLFLGSLLPVRDADEAEWVFRAVHDHWRFHYFQRLQHWLYVAVLVVGIAVLLLRRRPKKHSSIQAFKQSSIQAISLWWLLAIWFFGELLFAAAMLRQYHDHDYYFLDSLFLPIVMLLAGLLTLLPNPGRRWQRMAAQVTMLALTVAMTLEACNMQHQRRQEEPWTLATAVRFKHANAMLDAAGYGADSLRFMALFAYPQNTPFCMMDRQGYSVMWNDTAIVNPAMNYNFDYILIEDEAYRREFDSAQYILPRLQRLAGDGKLSLCILADTALHPTADHFFEQ